MFDQILIRMIEGAYTPSAAFACRFEISTRNSLVVAGVIKLLLAAMRVRTSESSWTSPLIPTILSSSRRMRLLPFKAYRRPIPYRGIPPQILIRVSVWTFVPIMMRTERTPKSLESQREEAFHISFADLAHVGTDHPFMLDGQERSANIIPGMSKGTEVTFTA